MKIRPTTRTIGALGGALLLVVMTASLALATPIQGATISINPSSAPAGASVTVSGNNFTPGSSIVIGYTTGDCSTNVTAIAGASATAGADGGVTVTFTWPATDTGTYYICATDTNTHSSTRSTGPLQVVPPATLTVSAPVYSGQPVTVTGAHFAPSTANGGGSVDVSYGGADGCATSAGTATVGADGSFSITFNAPHADSSTPITIVAVEPQGTCGKTNPGPTFQAKANATVSPAPSIRVSSPLNAGQNATVTGQSFLPVGAGISISYGASGSDGCATSLGSATAGADGSFSFTFKVPDVAADKSVVIAATSPLSSCAASPKLKATANATFKATKVTPTPPLLEYCLIGLLLLLLLLLLLFLIFRRRKEDEPVTIEERDTVRPSGTGTPGSAMIDRQIVARDRRGKEYVIAEEVTTVEEEEEPYR